ncbi:cytochrome b/b6 domain-containing protein [Vibrio vulnificus]|uniref:cytochrome b/b6 domain-containing protein n=1 Tax=Vibrio vulnificus TaxID=672 RepID=UPI001CDD457C|nr:cytochrome b/b6 domain-containing protein [Vibrio vulnificus]EGQ9783419.1 cytochrome b [Vibrio vulnificus]EGR0105609.1 cytochrome b [Vibrio vulnificus]EJO9866624.1 cytochrome b/b6 domain-containing protein [Vibrio vulnificus]ELK8438740.1 cytochrome b/b6 domain-containing protein [Vibrio vulnificus]MCA3980509.1 cytochrome b/b6 domain-containing protein [Vibrio vulnificus]
MTNTFKWDWVVRATHWTVAVLFFANFFVLEEGSEWHHWAGYLILLSLSLRLAWGLVVESPARLTRFLPSVSGALVHLKEVVRNRQDKHLGHNPAGAVMIWLLWSLLIATAGSGWLTESDLFWGEEWLEEVHEVLANLTLVAVAVHVSAVIFMSKWNRKNYLKSMLP